MKTPREFEEISVCPYCNAPTEEKFSGDEGWTFCPEGCGCLEGEKSVYKFICPDCEEVCDEDACTCVHFMNGGSDLSLKQANEDLLEANRELMEFLNAWQSAWILDGSRHPAWKNLSTTTEALLTKYKKS
jgi:hypothetical protein